MTIDLSQQEADTLIQLLDISTKSGGLQVAEACLHFFLKIKRAKEQGDKVVEGPEGEPQ